ncbi:MAG: hypothetical protein FWG12_04865 [Holophagaceae bacterium]|nr:hypothetical protein [Holophagaceae bacterium]
MSGKGFGTLANLAKIMEEASTDPESDVREDKRDTKPKTIQKIPPGPHKKKAMDPKRKAWYERRLREQMEAPQTAVPLAVATPVPNYAVTRKTAANAGNGLLSVLATAIETKPKEGTKRPEAWKRKPGDPIF